ncbi:MAG: type III-A CRISPR-associated RAMP protein Csm4 [Clostridia bacterium]|nr:type III-A CRISPR-associated RAMP protein Csm4 [Clostridia bacterium]
MRHMICKLRFHTAVRFGSDEGGSSLTGVSMTFRADTLFSALYQAFLEQNRAEDFLRAVRDGCLVFSDAMPWRQNRFFLPKPIGLFARPGDAREEDPSRRKLLKKIAYIPSDLLRDYLSGRADLIKLHELNQFGSAFEETRVNTRDGDQPLPYRVGGFRFAEDCGLYLIVSGDGEGLSLFEQGMTALAAGGIGGKTSSGWGKFSFEMGEASDAWRSALDDDSAPRQMLLSTALPADDELSAALEDAFYMLVRRGGFASSQEINPMKKQTVYLLSAGSTFRRRFAGTVLDVGVGMPHPVWRYARGLFMGVSA